MRLTLFLAFTLTASVVSAQQTTTPMSREASSWQVDARWGAWLGCWRAEDDLTNSGVRLCVTPDTVAGVKFQTIVGLDITSVETIIPDGTTRPIDDAGCRGTGRSIWSRNDRRLFRVNDVTCGAESSRKVSSLAFLLEGPVLVDVQFADLTDTKSVRVKRLVRSSNQTLPDGSLAPRSADIRGSAFSAPWTVEDVIEASGIVPADAVQAALTEAGTGFRLSKTSLLAMDEAGVSGDVIDLMVALTYPKRFVVERASARVDEIGYGGPSIDWWDPFLSPIVPFSMMGRSCYSAYAYGPMYGCSPFLSIYSMGPYFYSMYYPYPYSLGAYPYSEWVSLGSGSTSGGAVETGSAEGRVVNGRGYTQIRNREPVPVPVSRSGYGGDSSSGGGTSGTNSTGSSGVSSGGYSGGGSSSGDSGRTAVPRPPGGR